MKEVSVAEQPSFTSAQIQTAFQHFLQDLNYPIHANVLARQLEIFNAMYGSDIALEKVIGVIEKAGKNVLNKDFVLERSATVQDSVAETIEVKTWEDYVGVLTIRRWAEEMDNEVKIAAEKAEAEKLVNIFLGDMADLSDRDRSIYEPIREAFATRSEEFIFGGLFGTRFYRATFYELLDQFERYPTRGGMRSIMSDMPRDADCGLKVKFSQQVGDGGDEDERKLFCDRLKVMGACWHYFNSTEIFRANPEAQKAQIEQQQKIIGFKGFMEDPDKDFRILELDDRAALVAREWLVETLFQYFEEYPNSATLKTFKDYLNDEVSEPRMSLGFNYNVIMRLLSPEEPNRRSETYFSDSDAPDSEVSNILNSFGQGEGAYKALADLDPLTFSSTDLLYLRNLDQERLGLTNEIKAAIKEKERKAKETVWQVPEGMEADEWKQVVGLAIKAVLPKVDDWRDFLTDAEWECLEVFKTRSAQREAEATAAAQAKEKAEREAKWEARENDPEAAMGFIRGVIKHEIEACKNQDQAIKHVAQKLKGEFGGRKSDVIRLAKKHGITPKSIFDNHVEYGKTQLNRNARPRWDVLQRLEWQQICAVLGDVLELHPPKIPHFLKGNTPEEVLVLELWAFDRAEDESHLPDGVYDEVVQGQLDNFEKVSRAQRDDINSYSRSMFGGYGDFDDEHRFDEPGGDRPIDGVEDRRRLYNRTSVSLAWWLAPDWKRISALRQTVWDKIKAQRMPKERILEGFDSLFKQFDRNALLLERLLEDGPSRLPEPQKTDYAQAVAEQNRLEAALQRFLDEQVEAETDVPDNYKRMMRRMAIGDFPEIEDLRTAETKVATLINLDPQKEIIEAQQASLHKERSDLESLRASYERNFVWSKAEREADDAKKEAGRSRFMSDFGF